MAGNSTNFFVCFERVAEIESYSIRQERGAERKMFHLMSQRFTQLDFLGGRYYQSANDGMDGNNNATDSLCVSLPWPSLLACGRAVAGRC